MRNSANTSYVPTATPDVDTMENFDCLPRALRIILWDTPISLTVSAEDMMIPEVLVDTLEEFRDLARTWAQAVCEAYGPDHPDAAPGRPYIPPRRRAHA